MSKITIKQSELKSIIKEAIIDIVNKTLDEDALGSGLKTSDGQTFFETPYVIWTDKNGISSLSYVDTKEEFDAFVKTIPDTWDIYDDFNNAVSAFKQRFIDWDKRG